MTRIYNACCKTSPTLISVMWMEDCIIYVITEAACAGVSCIEVTSDRVQYPVGDFCDGGGGGGGDYDI